MKTLRTDIFKDRRNQRLGAPNDKACRRKGDFGEKTSDSTNWWLKVNYISQHLTTVKKVNDQHID